MRTILAAALAAVLAAPAAARAPARCDMPLKTVEGKTVRLSTFEKQVVLVDFWATFCEPCRAAKPYFEELQEKYGARGFIVLAVDERETRDVVRAYLKEHPTTLKVLLDPRSELERSLLLSGEPSMALFDSGGGLLWSATGFSPTTKEELRWRIDRLMPGEAGSVPIRALK